MVPADRCDCQRPVRDAAAAAAAAADGDGDDINDDDDGGGCGDDENDGWWVASDAAGKSWVARGAEFLLPSLRSESILPASTSSR